MSHLQKAIEDSIATLRGLSVLEEPLNRAAKLILQCLTSGKKLLVCGNGGSASDATHLATEFLCRLREDRRPYPAICSPPMANSALTAVCNDYHADEIFARQVWGLAEKGDVLIAITTSGKSKNILRALEEAKRGVSSIAIFVRDGGFTKGVATIDLMLPGASTARIQEGAKVLFHALCEMVEEKLAEGVKLSSLLRTRASTLNYLPLVLKVSKYGMAG